MKYGLHILAILTISSLSASGQNMVPVKDVIKHPGEKVSVCDRVFSEHIKKFVTTLFIGGDSPDQLLTVIIKTDFKTNLKGHFKNYARFEDYYSGKDVCITGVVKITKYGRAQIRVTDPVTD